MFLIGYLNINDDLDLETAKIKMFANFEFPNVACQCAACAFVPSPCSDPTVQFSEGVTFLFEFLYANQKFEDLGLWKSYNRPIWGKCDFPFQIPLQKKCDLGLETWNINFTLLYTERKV